MIITGGGSWMKKKHIIIPVGLAVAGMISVALYGSEKVGAAIISYDGSNKNVTSAVIEEGGGGDNDDDEWSDEYDEYFDEYDDYDDYYANRKHYSDYADMDPSMFGDVDEIEKLENKLMAKTWHKKGDEDNGFVFCENRQVRSFWGGTDYENSWVDGLWKVVYMDNDFNIGATADPEKAHYCILVNSNRFEFNKFAIDFPDDNTLVLTYDSYGEIYTQEMVAGDPLETDFPEGATCPDTFINIWQQTEDGVIERASGGYMGYIKGPWFIFNADGTGETRYGGFNGDFFAWRVKDNTLYLGLRPNNGLEDDVYMQVRYYIKKYEFSVIDDKNILLKNSKDGEEIRITHK
jgi:hypothetical protein